MNERGLAALVLAGDLLGVPYGYDSIEEAQRADCQVVAQILRRANIPTFYIMGNDDWVELDSPGLEVQSIHGRRVELGSFNLVGYQFSLPFMGGVFEQPEEEIAADLASLQALMNSDTVFVTHSPAYGILDLGILDRHAGSQSILNAVCGRGVRTHIHGHIHRCFGCHEHHFNVAADGIKRAMIIDLETLRHEIVLGEPEGDGK